MMKRKFFCAVCLLLLGASQQANFAGEQWETLRKCRLIPNQANDGDSFHVSHDGKESIFRIYFVDAPETDDRFKDRVAEQAAYFGISESVALTVGKEAARFTQIQLSKEFTIVTRWEDARGESKLPRHFAFVLIEGKKDLAEALAENGLARIYGAETTKPDGTKAKDVIAKLKRLEMDAKVKRRGAWAFTPKSKLFQPQPTRK